MRDFTTGAIPLPYLNNAVRPTLPSNAEVLAYSPLDGAQYEDTLRKAFNFLRRHDDGRYSSRTKMRVLSAAERAEKLRTEGATPTSSGLPGVLSVETPFSYDEDTEVKLGGVVAVAVVWPTEEGRLLLATHTEHRRNRIGQLLVEACRVLGVTELTAWVNRTNRAGQHFLLSLGFAATAINNSGGVCWQTHEPVDGMEDHLDPLDPRQRGDYQPPVSRSVYEMVEGLYDEAQAPSAF